ncbi:ExeM/NucH family extracellular endonuclease [Komarekiella sp. 'clone 1']|uniref:ExeM/NucH family extracellular endonuclease n=1 Tax=Komarekiella delphini-convector SJRDD-AB1 TaxID=2593771 RepID=A0AA40SVJ5_9NOST|nr:ExeM/NucH family extracellular endonuclease [Komarekiella delphini-convector SJRDD-AB1]
MDIVIINEIDSDTPSTDVAEFVELYDGGAGNTDLSGLVVVFYNGSNDLSYAAFDLDGYSTDANGYFVLGNAGIPGVDLIFPGNTLQNGADAVALYTANASDFPNNTPITTTNLIDAIAYDTNDADDPGLLALLNPSQPQVDENGGANGSANDSLQRVPNGAGGARNTSSYQALTPTPGKANAVLPAGVTITESGGSTNITEGGATDTYTIVLNSQPTANVTIAITPDSQSTTSATTLTFTAANWDVAQTVTVSAVDDPVTEGTHSSTISHTANSSDANYNNVAIASVTATIADNDVAVSITKIHEIQGSGATFNPAFGGNRTIEGVVVAAFSGSSQLNGFYVQEENTDADSDSTTSEAIFVFDPTGLFSGNVGDQVRVSGTVGEFTTSSGGVNSSLTQLSSVTSVVNLGASTLPTVTNIKLPVTSVTDLERYEGMLVNVSAATGNLTVTEHFQLGRFGQVVLSATDASNQPGTDGRLDQYTQFNAPSVSGYSAYLNEIAQRRIILDDGRGTQNPDPIIHARGGIPLSADNTLRGGDTISSINGVLDHRFEGYRVQTSIGQNFTPANPRPTTPPNVGGTLQVASFNVLNYFNGNGTGGGFPTPRGADTLTEFNRQRDKIIQAVIGSGADVLGLIEIENDGYGANSAIADLVNGLNAVSGAGTYAFINPGTSLGTDQITVGIIYKPGQVTPVGAAATMPDGYGQGAFDLTGRKPLAQTFRQNSNRENFTLVVNHFKSKGSSSGGVGDADAGDGQGLSNGTRTRAAQDLATWLATKPTGTNDPDYLVVGDLNAYAKEDPITTLASAGYNNQFSYDTYSYVFDGQWGTLDYALANGSLGAQVTGGAKWHINADEPNVLDYNTEFKSAGQQDSLYNDDAFRSSDHDPVLVGLNLFSVDKVITPPPARKVVIGTKGDDVIVGSPGIKAIAGGQGNDQFVYNSIKDTDNYIIDFKVGSDKIVLTKLLDSLVSGGYNGSDAIADGYVRVVQGRTAKNTVLQIDRDGLLGSAAYQPFLYIDNVTPAAMNNFYNFVF